MWIDVVIVVGGVLLLSLIAGRLFLYWKENRVLRMNDEWLKHIKERDRRDGRLE